MPGTDYFDYLALPIQCWVSRIGEPVSEPPSTGPRVLDLCECSFCSIDETLEKVCRIFQSHLTLRDVMSGCRENFA